MNTTHKQATDATDARESEIRKDIGLVYADVLQRMEDADRTKSLSAQADEVLAARIKLTEAKQAEDALNRTVKYNSTRSQSQASNNTRDPKPKKKVSSPEATATDTDTDSTSDETSKDESADSTDDKSERTPKKRRPVKGSIGAAFSEIWDTFGFESKKTVQS